MLVNPILKDRMYIVETKGYSNKDKVIIAQKYMLPKILEQVFFRPDEVIIPDDVIHYMLERPDLIVKEEGVRNLKRALEIIVKKLNLLRLMTTTPPPSVVDGSAATSASAKTTSGVQLFGEEFKFEIKFPMTVTKEHVDSIIKKKDTPARAWDSMFV
jgi:ATP-dependent Lon protease